MKRKKWIEPIYEYTFHIKPTLIVRTCKNLVSQKGNANGTSFAAGQKQDNSHSGIMSSMSVQKLKSAILWLVYSAEWKTFYREKSKKWYPFQLTFVTLTLPTQGEYTDQQVKQIMNNFLTSAKYVFGLRNYVWRMEPQKRGTAHIHLTADCYMHWKRLRQLWNKQLKRYNLLNGHVDPNSTDIHSLKSLNNIVGYLIKYYTKENEGRREINGRLWGCSHALTKARHLKVSGIESDGFKLFNQFRDAIDSYTEKDFFNLYYMQNRWFEKIPKGEIKKLVEETMQGIRYIPTTQEISFQ